MKLIGMEKVRDGYLKNYELTYLNKAGHEKKYEIVSHNNLSSPEELGRQMDGISIVAFHEDKMLLLKEFRMGVNRYVYNLCAGLMEPGESPTACMERELYEETGLKISRVIEVLPPVFAAVAISDIKTSLAFVEVSGEFADHTSENEEISAAFYSRDEVRELLQKEEFSSRAQLAAYYFVEGDRLFPNRGRYEEKSAKEAAGTDKSKNKKLLKKAYCSLCLGVSLFLTFAVLGLGAFAKESGVIYIKTSGEPKEAVCSFYDAVLNGEEDTARGYLLDRASLGLTGKDSSLPENLPEGCGEMFRNALLDSYAYELVGEPVVQGMNARQRVRFSYFDANLFACDLNALFEEMLEDAVQSRPRRDMFEDGDHYRANALEDIYANALGIAMQNRDLYQKTIEYTIELCYRDQEWKILLSDAMIEGFSGEVAPKSQQCDIIGSFLESVSNRRSVTLNEYLSGENMIRKVYHIPDGTTRGPEPNPACFGSASHDEADRVMDIIQQAEESGLLEGQQCVYRPDIDFYRRGTIKYYLDETIMVICWKERIDGKYVSFMEVKIADPSQFRRKLSGDAYGSGIQMFATQLAAQTNAVCACSADYYSFRSHGMLCYEGNVYRYGENPYGNGRLGNCLDTLFINRDGDFIFFDRNTDMTKEELQAYVDDNGLMFSLSFGPILVRDGVPQYHTGYPVGQLTEHYSRAGIGQIDHLHYLFAVVHYFGATSPGSTADEFADILAAKGVRQGYNLDGGQTGEYIFHDQVESYVDFGDERSVSDIIYFSTALPREDWE